MGELRSLGNARRVLQGCGDVPAAPATDTGSRHRNVVPDRDGQKAANDLDQSLRSLAPGPRPHSVNAC
jgi:hypothetical protein